MPTDTPTNNSDRARKTIFIVGAGINGCGVFRDLSLQGIDCVLIDRGDICEGASAAPSRLIHGGFKYLETGKFRLVRESCIERNRLLRNAPHYVVPLPTFIPVRSWFGGIMSSALRFLGLKTKLNDRGAIITEFGLRIYDAFNRKVQALPDHQFFGSARLRRELPHFEKGIVAASLYYEGQVTHAERLCAELVFDGLRANPQSRVKTYSAIKAAHPNGSIIIIDRITGEQQSFKADLVINAAGAWIDDVNKQLGFNSSYIGGSKGAHLIVDAPELYKSLKGRMIYFATADGRVNLVYPYFNHILIGSTDIRVKHADDVFCSDDEIDYLLNVVREIFPTMALSRQDIVLTYSGVRPLPRGDGDIGAVSRDHQIAHDKVQASGTPVMSLIGGKWTTFRAFSEEAVDKVLQHFAITRQHPTTDLAIGGGKDYPATNDFQIYCVREAALAGVDLERFRKLLKRYGTIAKSIATFEAQARGIMLKSLPSYSRAEIVHLCRHEHVRRLTDIILRRTEMAMSGDVSPTVIHELADIAAAEFGWDATRKQIEIDFATAEMARRNARHFSVETKFNLNVEIEETVG